ncbi:DoxX family protein [uncultured Marixanthomonas sp.]|uniref:DoxX family protein n=1 Tax=uncultured Marixanthomonas sp. TaxID=757245 RepID=UPI0030D878E1|tara:strand:+ start:204 stop:638 length:435 start_codon:yes stop_codon:yes gene_type:complete
MKKISNNQLAFFIARITIGINLLVHGLVRIPKLEAFANGIVKGFSETYLPEILVTSFAFGIPFIEFIIGSLLLIGWKTKYAAAAGGFLIALLILGSAFKEDWGAVGTQMVYAIFFFLLIKNLDHNYWSIDTNARKKIDGFKTER